MVKEEQHYPAIGEGIISDTHAHHRGLAHIEPVVTRIEASPQLFTNISSRWFDAYLFDHQRSLTPDHLHWFGQPFPQHCGAQNVVPSDYRPQGLEKAVQALSRVECHHGLQ